MEFDTLTEISRDATLEASKALSKFVSVPVSLGTVHVEMTKDIELTCDMDSSEQIYAISGSIVGDATGLAMLCLPMRTACGLCDLLFKQELGTIRAITPDEEDALLELGNIVVGNYLRSFSRAMPGTTLVHKTATMSSDVWSKLKARLATTWPSSEPTHHTMLFEVSFGFRHASLAGCVMVVLEANRVRSLIESAANV